TAAPRNGQVTFRRTSSASAGSARATGRPRPAAGVAVSALPLVDGALSTIRDCSTVFSHRPSAAESHRILGCRHHEAARRNGPRAGRWYRIPAAPRLPGNPPVSSQQRAPMTTRYDLDPPAVTVRLDRLESNIRRVQALLAGHGIANRPHIKTH